MAIGPIYQPLDANYKSIPGALPAPQYVDARVLATNTAEAHTVPTGAKFVRIAANAIVYARYNGTAAVPAADVTDGSAPEVIPPNWVELRDIRGVTSISLIAPAATIVTLSFYSE